MWVMHANVDYYVDLSSMLPASTPCFFLPTFTSSYLSFYSNVVIIGDLESYPGDLQHCIGKERWRFHCDSQMQVDAYG